MACVVFEIDVGFGRAVAVADLDLVMELDLVEDLDPVPDLDLVEDLDPVPDLDLVEDLDPVPVQDPVEDLDPMGKEQEDHWRPWHCGLSRDLAN